MNIPLIISRIFEPIPIALLLTILGAVHAGLVGASLWVFIIGLVVCCIGVLFIQVWFVKTKQIADWDMKKRKERIKPLSFLLICLLVGSLSIQSEQFAGLRPLFFLYIVWLTGFVLITLKYKISGHVGTLTLAVVLMLQWYGWQWWPIILTIPLLAWARVVGKFHTLPQVVGGGMYSVVVVEVVQGVFH